jgi:hypothetical protein
MKEVFYEAGVETLNVNHAYFIDYHMRPATPTPHTAHNVTQKHLVSQYVHWTGDKKQNFYNTVMKTTKTVHQCAPFKD